MTTTLVLGGARSGKTAYALRTAEASPDRLVMIATAEPLDAEMRERIARHRAERGARWRTLERPLQLPQALLRLEPGERAVVDCLTLWLSNLMHADLDIEAMTDDLCAALPGKDVLLVSNEVGLGVVPETALGRRFRDAAGRMNQRLASVTDQVVMIVSGLPLVLKGG